MEAAHWTGRVQGSDTDNPVHKHFGCFWGTWITLINHQGNRRLEMRRTFLLLPATAWFPTMNFSHLGQTDMRQRMGEIRVSKGELKMGNLHSYVCWTFLCPFWPQWKQRHSIQRKLLLPNNRCSGERQEVTDGENHCSEGNKLLLNPGLKWKKTNYWW